MSQDEYGIYRKPTGSVIAAWLGIAAAIFFGAYAFKMKDRLQDAHEKTQSAREEAGQMKSQMISLLGELQAMKAEVSALKERSAILPAASATNEQIYRKQESAPAIPTLLTARTVPTAIAQEAAKQTPARVELAKKDSAPVLAPTSSGASVAAEQLILPENEPVAIAAAAATTQSVKAAVEEAVRLSGEIVSYNPDTRKVYISLGSANGGLQPGSRFSVWRGDKYVTDIRVVKVFSVTSTCEVEGPTPIGVRSGDIAKIAAGSPGA